LASFQPRHSEKGVCRYQFAYFPKTTTYGHVRTGTELKSRNSAPLYDEAMFDTPENEPSSFVLQILLSIAIAIPVALVFFFAFYQFVVSRPPDGSWLVPAAAIYLGFPLSVVVCLVVFLVALATQVILDHRRLARLKAEDE
jgi:hypothetical protein